MVKKYRSSLQCSRLGYIFTNLLGLKVIFAFSRRPYNYDLRVAKTQPKRAAIIKQRRQFLKSLKIDIRNSVFVTQPHKAKVYKAKAKDRGRGAGSFKQSLVGYDALVTDVPDLALCVLTADCLPLVFVDAKRKVVGIAHAGWRGTKAHIVRNVIKTMVGYNCRLCDIHVFVGPGIRQCCYRVGKDLKFKSRNFSKKKKNGLYLDLVGANKNQVIAAGIDENNIVDTNLCSSCKNRIFFSYRRGDKGNRMLSVVMLKDDSK